MPISDPDVPSIVIIFIIYIDYDVHTFLELDIPRVLSRLYPPIFCVFLVDDVFK